MRIKIMCTDQNISDNYTNSKGDNSAVEQLPAVTV